VVVVGAGYNGLVMVLYLVKVGIWMLVFEW